MKISVRLEGGIGDHLLGNRFVPAIKELHPEAKIFAYLDTEGNTFQKEALEALYPSLYEDVKVITEKRDKKFKITSQFGEEVYIGALENVPERWTEEMLDYDKFYDLHIDSLKFTDYDFDWLRYFYFFPKPELQPPTSDDDYVILHLQSATSQAHRLEDWYCTRLVEEISKFSKCILILTPDQQDFFSWAEGMNNVEMLTGDIKTIFAKIGGAKALVSTDSGFRYAAYAYGVPVVTFSSDCRQPHQIPPSHQIRWLMFPNHCYPLNYQCDHISKSVKNILENKCASFFPHHEDMDQVLIRRART